MNQNVLAHLRTYSYKSRLNIKNGALVLGLLSSAFSYFYYRLWRSKTFEHNNGVYRLSLSCDNGTPLISMFTQWYRLPLREYNMTRQFMPYYIMGYIDYEKEILIPRTITLDGVSYKGFDVINPFYCMDDADIFKVYPQFTLKHGITKSPGIIKNKVAKRKNSVTNPIAKLGKQETDKLKQTFQAFDQDNDGLLSVKGLARSLFAMKYEFDKDELHSMFSQADTANTGHINLNEFLTLIANHKETYEQQQQILAALKVFDSKEQGKIQCCQAYQVLKKLDVLSQSQIKDILIKADRDESNWEHQLICTKDLCRQVRELKRTLRKRQNVVQQEGQRITALNLKQVPLSKQQNAFPTPGALVLNRGWIPYEMRDKLKRSHQVTKKKLTTVYGTFRPGKDIHDYTVPNNAHNNEWYNMALEDIVKFWELPNQYDNKYYYFQAVQIGSQSNGKSIVDADDRQHEFPKPISVDDVIADELEFKISIKNTKRISQVFGAFTTMSALLYLIA